MAVSPGGKMGMVLISGEGEGSFQNLWPLYIRGRWDLCVS